MIQLDLFLQRFPLHILKQRGSDCPWCGRGTKAYGYELDDKLVKRAIQIADYCQRTRRMEFNPKEVFGKTDTEFNKLKYWGILRKEGSWWRLTRAGFEFLRGNQSMSKKVWVYDDTVITEEDQYIKIDAVEPRWKEIAAHWTLDYILYPTRPQQAYAPKLL